VDWVAAAVWLCVPPVRLRRQGLADVDRHVIQRTLIPRVSSNMATYDMESNICQAFKVALHVIGCNFSRETRNQSALDDMESYICQAL